MVLYSVLFLILAALAPPLILMGIIYRLDQIEREPPGLLWSLFLRGVLAMVPILVLEMLADQFNDFFYWRPMVYLFLAYFVVPGFIEEGIKYRVLRPLPPYERSTLFLPNTLIFAPEARGSAFCSFFSSTNPSEQISMFLALALAKASSLLADCVAGYMEAMPSS